MHNSPNDLVSFSPEDEPEITITVKPATGPQKTKMVGAMQRAGENLGELATQIAYKHVRGIEGVDFQFNHNNKKTFDNWKVSWFMETLNFVAFGNEFTGEDAKNSE